MTVDRQRKRHRGMPKHLTDNLGMNPRQQQEWYELADIASMWNVPIVWVREAVSNLESAGVIEVRERPGDKRYKQVNKNSLPTLRKAVLGS